MAGITGRRGSTPGSNLHRATRLAQIGFRVFNHPEEINTTARVKMENHRSSGNSLKTGRLALSQFGNRSTAFDHNWRRPALRTHPVCIQIDAQMTECRRRQILRSDRAGIDGSSTPVR